MSPRAFGHTGFTGTSLWVDPAVDLVAVLLTDATHPRVDRSRGANRLRARFHNVLAANVLAPWSGQPRRPEVERAPGPRPFVPLMGSVRC